MQLKQRHSLLYLLIPLILLALCAPFLSNPLVFDDVYFFLLGAPEKFFSDGLHFSSPRWWVYETLAATFVLAGPELYWLRFGNLLAHTGTALALYFLIRRLLIDLDTKKVIGVSPEFAALTAATFFALQPLAIFAQGYLIQRTIVCATLFALLSWLAFWRGLGGSRSWLWISCLLCAISIYAKEHAVMVPAISFGFLLLYQRSRLKPRGSLGEIWCVLLLQALLALFVVLQAKGIIGTPYEIMTTELLDGETDIPAHTLYPLSIMNQTGLFFKYLSAWCFPNVGAMSIDIRTPFPLDLASWSLWGGVFLFAAYGITSFTFLLRGNAIGLLGLGLLTPWLLFATEFAAVRLQEPFVLYRSYLWAPSLFFILALGVRRIQPKMLYLFLPLLCLYLFALSFDRLTTLSRPLLLWQEAALHIERGPQEQGVFGAYRIYYNRGHAFQQAGMLEAALADYEHVLQLKPNYAHAHHQLGVIYLEKKQWEKAQESFEKAIAQLPDNFKSHLGLARAFEATGKKQQANTALQTACAMGSSYGCEKLTKTEASPP